VIFVDTGAWFALLVPNDRDHAAAARWLGLNREPLITTDYVLDETLTLLKVRAETKRALDWGARMLAGELAGIERVAWNDFGQAWEMFCRFRDKGWSFTDCTSFVVMARLGVDAAFSFDEHFRQYGKIRGVP